jgi:hypothetical protein
LDLVVQVAEKEEQVLQLELGQAQELEPEQLRLCRFLVLQQRL